VKDASALPDSFYEHMDGKSVVARLRWPSAPSQMQIVLLLAAPPLLCLAGVLAWRRFFPDEGQRLRQHRLCAAPRALAQLRSAPASALEVVRRYLHERFDFAVVDPTPAEVFVFLKRRGFALALCKESQAFFQACDAARYTMDSFQEPTPLADVAARVIQALDGDPCARV